MIQIKQKYANVFVSYTLAMSVSVRLPSDQAALARTLGERSSRAVRVAFAVSATNITSWE